MTSSAYSAQPGSRSVEKSEQTVTPVTPVRSPFLTVPEVADHLRCSARSIHELTRFRRIPHRKLPGGRRILFLRAELDAWVDGRRAGCG
jgi:excisionase family DNA binding protein